MATHRPVSQNWMENVTSDCSVLYVSLHHPVPKSVLAHNVISQKSLEHLAADMEGMYPAKLYLLLWTDLYKSLHPRSLVNGNFP